MPPPADPAGPRSEPRPGPIASSCPGRTSGPPGGTPISEVGAVSGARATLNRRAEPPTADVAPGTFQELPAAGCGPPERRTPAPAPRTPGRDRRAIAPGAGAGRAGPAP